MNLSKITIPLLVASGLLASCSYTAKPSSELPRYFSSSSCSARWNHVKGIQKYWFPGSVNPPNYIMYKNHIIEAWQVIGDIYYSGCPSANIAQNKETAFFWYQSAALAHVSSAQYKIGMMLLNGDGVQTDRKRGIDWLSSAAIEGSGEARSYLESIGMTPPPAISPSSYQTYQELARQDLIKGQERDRAAVMHDLGRLAVNTVQLVSEAILLYSVSQSMTNNAPVAAPRVKYVERTRPVYCSVYSQTNELFNAVTVNANVFCH